MPDSLSDQLRTWLLRPVLDRLTRLGEMIMASYEDIEGAVQRSGDAIRGVTLLVLDQRGKIAALVRAVEDARAGQVDPERLAAIAASIDANTDAMAQALAPAVEDPAVPTEGVEVPPEQNPDTPDPSGVDGAALAGEPFPEDGAA